MSRGETVDFPRIGEGAVGLDRVGDGDDGDLGGIVSALFDDMVCCFSACSWEDRRDDAWILLVGGIMIHRFLVGTARS